VRRQQKITVKTHIR